jgi:hypothetical protein
MVFLSRVDDQIDIAGFTRLSEKVIWQAIENSGVHYADWVARKEVKREKPVLHLYIELTEDGTGLTEEVASTIHEELKKLDEPYAELEAFTGLNPFEVTILPCGTFASYKAQQQKAGADLTQLKPPHINPPDETLTTLLTYSGVESQVRAKIAV